MAANLLEPLRILDAQRRAFVQPGRLLRDGLQYGQCDLGIQHRFEQSH